MKSKFAAVLLAFAFTGSMQVTMSAQETATCTAEDINKKAMEISAKLTELAQKDPQKMQEVSLEYANLAKEFQAAGTDADFEKLCKLYDELLAKVE